MKQTNLTYKDSGVDYDAMDPFKRRCQLAAIETRHNLDRFGITEVEWSRGESAYALHVPNGGFITLVNEGLGTKNLVADTLHERLKSIAAKNKDLTTAYYYRTLSQDTVAMIVNDAITIGSFPITLGMHLEAGDSAWFDDTDRSNAIIEGWKDACNLSRCSWGGGETPTLKGIIIPNTFSLSGAGIGYSRILNPPHVENGDAIIFFGSSGIHANGLSAARKIAENVRGGYMAPISVSEDYGEALLTPTHIYVGAIEDLMNAGIDIHYSVNITGHGWRKLMRLKEPFTYRITYTPHPQEIFNFIQKQGPMTDEEMYGNFNMGAGFAIYIREDQVVETLELINRGTKYGFRAWCAGKIEKGEKQVIIEQKDIVFKGETLGVR